MNWSDCLKALDWLSKHIADDLDDSHDDGFIEALNASAKDDWKDEE